MMIGNPDGEFTFSSAHPCEPQPMPGVATLMKRITSVLAVVLTLLCAGAGYTLLATDRGTVLWSDLLQSFLPSLTLEGIEGNLRDGLSIQQLHWQDDATALTLQHVATRLDLSALWTQGLSLPYLNIQRLSLTVPIQDHTDATTNPPTHLPRINLPLGLNIGQMDIHEIQINHADSPVEISEVRLRLRWRGDEVHILELRGTMLDTQVHAHGRLALRRAYPLQARVVIDHAQAGAQAKLSGDLRRLSIALQVEGPARATGTVQLQPLEDDLPLQASLTLSQPWETELGQLDKAELQLSGHGLGALNVSLKGRFNPQANYGSTPLDLALDAHYHDGHLALNNLQLQRAGQQLLGNCQQFRIASHTLNCQGTITLNHLAPWLEDLDATLHTPWSLKLVLAPDWQLNLNLPDLTGQWQERSLTGKLALQVTDQSVALAPLHLQIGRNTLHLDGVLGSPAQILTATLQADALQQLHPQLSGTLGGQLEISGSQSQPSIHGQLQARHPGWEAQHLDAMQLELAISNAALAPSQAQLTLHGPAGQGSLRLGLSGTRAEHALTLHSRHDDYAGLDLLCHGAHHAPLWTLSCPDVVVHTESQLPAARLTAEKAPVVRWHRDKQLLTISPFCLREEEARICLARPFHWQPAGPEPLAIEASGWAATRANSMLPSNWQRIDGGQFSGQAMISSWQPLILEARLTAVDLGARWNASDPSTALHYERADAVLTMSEDQLQLSVVAHSRQLGGINGALQVDRPDAERLLHGQLRFEQLDLAALSWTLPNAQQLSGTVDGQIIIRGTTHAPQLNGRVSLQQGRAELPLLTYPLALELSSEFDADQALLRGTFTSGPGHGTLTGQLYWAEDTALQANVTLTADQLALTPLPDSSMILSPDLQLQWNTPSSAEKLTLNGRIAIDEARIVLQELPENAVRVSPDAVLIDAPEDDQPPAPPLHARLTVALGEQFQFKGFGAYARLAGTLDLAYDQGEPLRAYGEITVPEGRYRAYGQRLSVRRGSILFDGNAQSPDLDIEALRDLHRRDIVVGIHITGTPQRPYAQLFSEPAMPDTTVAYYLLTGQPPSSGTPGGEIAGESLLMSLGLAGAENPASQLAERIGIHDLQLGTSTGEHGTEAQISAYLRPGLYVRYGVSLEESAANFTVQYQLTPRLFLEAISGLDSALDLIYTYERPHPSAAEPADKQGTDS